VYITYSSYNTHGQVHKPLNSGHYDSAVLVTAAPYAVAWRFKSCSETCLFFFFLLKLSTYSVKTCLCFFCRSKLNLVIQIQNSRQLAVCITAGRVTVRLTNFNTLGRPCVSLYRSAHSDGSRKLLFTMRSFVITVSCSCSVWTVQTLLWKKFRTFVMDMLLYGTFLHYVLLDNLLSLYSSACSTQCIPILAPLSE